MFLLSMSIWKNSADTLECSKKNVLYFLMNIFIQTKTEKQEKWKFHHTIRTSISHDVIPKNFCTLKSESNNMHAHHKNMTKKKLIWNFFKCTGPKFSKTIKLSFAQQFTKQSLNRNLSMFSNTNFFQLFMLSRRIYSEIFRFRNQS